MEGNKDEASRCLSLAKRMFLEGNLEKALKFANKSNRLYPSRPAAELLHEINERSKSDGSNKKETPENNNIRNRKVRTNQREDNTADSNQKKNYTPEQLDAVKRIKTCKDYYQILGVEKDATKVDLKKAYRKLALQLHPDKNVAPGASEAFKAVSNAFGVLNDDQKRRRYDQFGEEKDVPTQHYREYYTNDFESDISPEDLFNMFFGGSFPSGGRVYVHRNHRRSSRPRYHQEQEEPATFNWLPALQFVPILILFLMGVISPLLVDPSPYSLSRSLYYPQQRSTADGVSYYVASNFERKFDSAKIYEIENDVKREYLGLLQERCWRDKRQRELLIHQAKLWGDEKKIEEYKTMTLRSCNELERLVS
ncbi:DnaJ-like protein subfamily B member 12 [Trichoplax sp. H2]|uniref:J domain-containing protein n=1 Tax=Trichoplax adhaerens TaxID=10228 RepID=B3RVS8_TRIAD|nr:hypothetical protein TRIADDRAFT_55761 [Trichoplax adhaerens]EDV25550.1 hypothetical protein TRIADDRAFT_55761 [Trichoplax adhaerens]RDD46942.1 DnaJ-like protein subfamily B member 12 [Trichoplax sp. H2]|eukprot:XP_002111583.1 hypothetical protein TRIADDRAFT_55761 [Trichoplax adhaerens]